MERSYQFTKRSYNPNVHDCFKALTVKQPWADRIAEGKKNIEVRNRYTRYRGNLIITASAHPPKQRSGMTICSVELADIIRFKDLTEEQKYMTGIPKNKWKYHESRYGWILKNPKPVSHIPIKGQLGIWNLVLLKGMLDNKNINPLHYKIAKNLREAKKLKVAFIIVIFVAIMMLIFLN